MSETTQVAPVTGQAQPETTTTSILDRLSKDFGGEEVKVTTPITEQTQTSLEQTNKLEGESQPTELTAEEKTALANEAKELGLPETATKDEVEKYKADKLAETTWKLDEVVKSPEEENDGTWKGLIESFGLGEIPEDYTEERGFEVVQDLFNKKLEAAKSEALSEAKYNRYVDVPEQVRGEAEMVVELMKSGQTLEQINAPFVELAQIKAMDKEGLVRFRLESQQGWDADMVDAKMQKIIESGTLDVEYKIVKAELDSYEQSLNHQRQEQIKNYQNGQKQIQAQKASQENAKLKHALDGVQEYLGKKLPSEVKEKLFYELATDEYRNLPGTPQEKVDYFLHRKFGKSFMKSFQDRVLEKTVLENKQKQHNVPILQNGSANRVTQTNTNKTVAEQRLEQQFGT